MENRKPFELRKVLIVYNFAQVIFSAWLFYEVIIIILNKINKKNNIHLFIIISLQSCIGGWLNGYNLRCEPVDYSYTPKALRVSKFKFYNLRILKTNLFFLV